MKAKVTIEGLSPLLMNSNAVVDPLHPISIEKKKISGKRKKTEADYEELKRLDFYGAIYQSKGRLVIPARCLMASLESGAKKSKDGAKVREGCFISEPGEFIIPTKYESIDDLYKNEDHIFTTVVRVNRASVLKTRPIFQEWRCEFTVEFLDDIASKNDIKEFLITAGRRVGLCDWRPQHGRFKVVEFS